MNLFRELRKELELTIIFIAHQLSIISHVADEVAVIYLGKIDEHGTTKEIFSNPKHPYTKALLAAHPHPDSRENSVPQMQGVIPSSLDLPRGCHFFTRCPQAVTVQRGDDHKVTCHFWTYS